MKKTYKQELKRLGKKVKDMRIISGYTQQKLADLCEVDIRTIQRIEKGESGIGLPLIYAIADAFKITINQLLQD